MKKRIISLVLILTMLGLFVPSGAGSMNVFADGDFVIQNGVLTKYTGAGGRVVIPDGVTEIGKNVFYGNRNVTFVAFPDSVITVEESAFYNCEGLLGVTLGNSVRTIGRSAFYGCTNLRSLTLPDTVVKLDDSALGRCNSLTTFVLPESLDYIGSYVFRDCNKLSSIDVSKANANYASDNGLLYNHEKSTLLFCPEGRTGRVTLPDSVTKIGNGAFYNCKGLTAVDIPHSVTVIPDYAFCYCKGLKKIDIPDSVTKIGYKAFCKCTSLESVEISDSVKILGGDSFRYCESLRRIKVSDSITYIRSRTFSDCPQLQEVILPSKLDAIGEYAFSSCWKLKGIVLPDTVTSIETHAFEYCVKLTGAMLPKQLSSLGSEAFLGCTGLLCATMPKSVTVIGWKTFNGCKNLKDVYFEGNRQEWTELNGDNAGLPADTVIHFNTDISDIDCKITSQPVSQTIELGQPVTLSLKAAGAVLNYQWYFKKAGSSSFSEWKGRTHATETCTPNATWNGIQLYCVVKDCSGKQVRSDTISVKVTQELMITCQPSNQTVELGNPISISLTAQGLDLTYQWYYKKAGQTSWSIWKNRTHASETCTPNATWDGIQLYCYVKDSSGKTVQSETIKITVTQKIKITTQPTNKTINLGDSVTLSLKAEGSGLTYQWYFKKAGQTSFSKWNNRTHASETVTPNDTWNGIQLYCIVKDSAGNQVKSNTITVTVNQECKIVTQPTDKTINLGDSVTLSLKAQGSGLTYQWYFKKVGQTSWNKWNNRTHASETVTPNATWDGIKLYCLVKDASGNSVNSKVITVTVKSAAITITQQPANVTTSAGSDVKFTVKASGTGLKYQWQYKKSGQTSWSNWGSRTTASTTATANATWNGMQVRCVVTDSAGNKVTSSAAKITIK